MIEGIEQYYQQIGNAIQDSIEEDWLRAVVEVTVYSEHFDFHNEYSTAGNPEPQGFFINREGRAAFLELHDLVRKAGKPVWCRARFEINSDGKFKMDCGYDSDGKGFAPYDPDAEQRRRKA